MYRREKQEKDKVCPRAKAKVIAVPQDLMDDKSESRIRTSIKSSKTGVTQINCKLRAFSILTYLECG